MIEITTEYLASQGLSPTFQTRFWAKVQKTEGCWLWTGGFHDRRTRYGALARGHGCQTINTHIASWILHFGPIPDGLWVLHHCDNPPCVRPDHLWLGTNVENMRDMAQKGRSTMGDKSHTAKLTLIQVEQIRNEWSKRKSSQRDLAKKFGIHNSGICRIVNWKNWSNPNLYLTPPPFVLSSTAGTQSLPAVHPGEHSSRSGSPS